MERPTLVGRELYRRVVLGLSRADERLLKVLWVVHDDDHGQVLAMFDDMFAQRSLIAHVDAVALHPAFFQVGRLDRQLIALPGTSREACPGMTRQLRGMRAAVQPDGTVGAAERPFKTKSDDSVGQRLEDIRDAE